MNRNDLTALATRFENTRVNVTYIHKGEDGEPFETTIALLVTGKVNTKGLVVRHHADEASFTIAPSKVVNIAPVTSDATDGMTSREVAEIFNMTAKELRVITRRIGLGVGKGRRYMFDTNDVNAIRQTINNG
jgi:hypothetical protein